MGSLLAVEDTSSTSSDGDDVEPNDEFDDGYLQWPCTEEVGVGGVEQSDAVHEPSLAVESCGVEAELASVEGNGCDCLVAIKFGSCNGLSSRMVKVVELLRCRSRIPSQL